MPTSARAQARFPQPVQVAALIGRHLIMPDEGQQIIGKVRQVVRNADGDEVLVIETGGWFAWAGIGTRDVLVAPFDCVLLGEWVALVDVEADDFAKLPA